MINSRITPTPLPVSAWGYEAAKVAANEDFARAAADPRDEAADYAAALARALQS